MQNDASRINVLVTVNRDAMVLEHAVSALQEAGMHVDHVFGLGGVVAGDIPKGDLQRFRDLKVAAAVEEEPILSSSV